MPIRRPWLLILAVGAIGLGSWLLIAMLTSPGQHSTGWQALEISSLTVFAGIILYTARNVARADARHFRRLRWEREGRCGDCGCELGPDATSCPGCHAIVAPRLPGGSGRTACLTCGYSLVGIRGNRCPECGALAPAQITRDSG